MIELRLSDAGQGGFRDAFNRAREWAAQHGWQVGVAEMALGAGLIAVGVKTGAIEMGTQLVTSLFDHHTREGAIGAAVGAALGTLPGLVLKSIGVAAVGTAVSVPAIVLMGGGTLVLGLAGYGVGRLISDFLRPVPLMADVIGPGALLLVGVALLVDGARRVIQDELVQALAARYKDGVLELGRIAANRALASKDALVDYLNDEIRGIAKELATNPVALGTTGAAMAGGAGVGSVLAASSVTVMGSQALGGVALKLGLVSAPVWPVVVGGAAALLPVYGVWRYARGKRSAKASPRAVLSLPPMGALGPSDEPDAAS